jgi:hypothetical protein
LALETKYKNLVPPKRRTGWNRVLVELDGCQIRTGILVSNETKELTPKEKLDKIGQPSLVLGLELLIFRSWQAKRATY